MLRLVCWCLLLVSCCSACAAGAGRGVVSGKVDAATPPVRENVDTSCSYFYYLWGKSAEAGHRFEEALEAYQKALVCDPEAEHLMRELAVFMVKLGRKDEAVALLDRLLILHPGDVQLVIVKANLYAAMGDVEKAAAAYNAVLAIDPKNADTLLRLGSLYARDGRYDMAREVLERLVRLDDRSFIGYQYLAKLYREVREYDLAEAAYEKALALHWLPDLAMEAADVYELQGRDDKVVELCRRVLADDPGEEKARQRLVRLFLRQGEADKALDELWDYRLHADNVDEVDYTIGRVLLENNRFDAAIDHFSDMLERTPDSGNIRYLLALAYGSKGETKEAGTLLRQVTPADGVYEDAVMLLVEFLVKDKAEAEADALLAKAIADPVSRRPRFYAGLAGLKQRQGQNDAGREIFRKGLALYPKDSQLRYDYGLFLDRSGAGAEALAAMEEVLRLEPDNAYALNYVGYTWADAGHNLEEACKYIEQAVQLRPEDGFVRDSLGWVYFKLGRMEQAAVELRKALKLTKDPVIFEHLGDVEHAAGNQAEAIRAYEHAKGLFGKEADQQRVEEKIKALRTKQSP